MRLTKKQRLERELELMQEDSEVEREFILCKTKFGFVWESTKLHLANGKILMAPFVPLIELINMNMLGRYPQVDKVTGMYIYNPHFYNFK